MVNLDEAILSLIDKWNGWGTILFVVIAVTITGILSSFIGIERELKGQPAGLRTHVLLAIGSCLLMMISIFAIQFSLRFSNSDSEGMWNMNLDVSRIGSGIVSGIGFMGAGAIVKNGLTIRGLTTAATLWLAAAVGMACGAGFILEAIAVTIIALIFLIGLSKVEKLLDKTSPRVQMIVAPNIPILHEIRTQADRYRLIIKNIVSNTSTGADGKEQTEITVIFAYHSLDVTIDDFVDTFASYPYVYKVTKSKEKKNKDIAND